MPIKVVRSAICDQCNLEIDISKEYVDAMVYGVTFHKVCFNSLHSSRLLRLLGLDDIVIKKDDQTISRAMELFKENING